jgi:lantibiotic modifying enzyme
MRWSPLITGTQSIPYRKRLDEIASDLVREWTKMEDPGLMGGLAGIALFFWHYSLFTGSSFYRDTVYKILDKIVSGIDEGFSHPSLADGVTGIAWTLAHLKGNGLTLDNEEDLLIPLDRFLDRYLCHNCDSRDYDYLHGIMGIAFYLSQRRKKNPSVESPGNLFYQMNGENHGTTLKAVHPGNLEAYLHGPVVDLGLAHGVTGIIAFLNEAIRLRVNGSSDMKQTLRFAIGFLLAQQRNPDRSGSCFPNKTGDKNRRSISRLAWCYGDLGIGMVLLESSIILNDKRLEAFSMKLLDHSARRLDPASNKVTDASLCHGSSGIAHIFNRLYQKTGTGSFLSPAMHWLRVTLETTGDPMNQPGLVCGKCEPDSGNRMPYGLLEGKAGIGLSLLAAISTITPGWDNVLMIN